MQSVSDFIENKLKLMVSKDKIKVCSIDQIKFLGCTITEMDTYNVQNEPTEAKREYTHDYQK
jgi:hypothetical protein